MFLLLRRCNDGVNTFVFRDDVVVVNEALPVEQNLFASLQTDLSACRDNDFCHKQRVGAAPRSSSVDKYEQWTFTKTHNLRPHRQGEKWIHPCIAATVNLYGRTAYSARLWAFEKPHNCQRYFHSR